MVVGEAILSGTGRLTSLFLAESPTNVRALGFRYFDSVHGFWYSISTPTGAPEREYLNGTFLCANLPPRMVAPIQDR